MKLIPVNQQDDWFNILVYGEPDSGKTTFAGSGASHPEFSKTVIINIEGGLQSIRCTKALMTPKIESTEQFDQVMQAAATRKGDWGNVRLLVLDSATELQRLLLNDIVARKHKARPRKGGVDETQISDYGDLAKAMSRYGAMLRGLPCHVVITALLRDRKSDGSDRITSITPALTEASDRALRAQADQVWMLRKIPAVDAKPATDDTEAVPAKDAYVAMLTQAKGLFVAKTRNTEFREALPPVVTNPTLPMVYNIFTKALGKGQKADT